MREVVGSITGPVESDAVSITVATAAMGSITGPVESDAVSITVATAAIFFLELHCSGAKHGDGSRYTLRRNTMSTGMMKS